MNILILSGSPRKGGNTDLLAEAFAKGAAEHHNVEIVSVRDYKVNPCLGCNACLKFFNIEDAGKVLVRGVKEKGDIKNTDALNEAYNLGLSI